MCKTTVFAIIMIISLVSTVNALGVSPLHLDLTVERGKETQIVHNIQVLNSEETPLHVTASATGSIAQFTMIEPKEFDIDAGPGAFSTKARPFKYITVTFTIPREVSESSYKGEILFTERPTTGGALGTALEVPVTVNLKIGTVAPAKFPSYVMIMVVLLAVIIILSILYAKKTGFNKNFLGIWIYAVLCLILILLYEFYTNIFDYKISGYNLSLWSVLAVNVFLIITSILIFKRSKIIAILGIVFAPMSAYLFYQSWTNYIYNYLVIFLAIPIILLLLSLKKK
jgi:hypothetical protein